MLKTREGGELPATLTELYINFLVVQMKLKNVKYEGRAETDSHWNPQSRKMIVSLASVYSGVFIQIFKEERGLYQDKMFCFVHLSIQEFLAALYVHLTFITSCINLLSEEPSTNHEYAVTRFYQSAVDKALQSPNGHLDLFLRSSSWVFHWRPIRFVWKACWHRQEAAQGSIREQSST